MDGGKRNQAQSSASKSKRWQTKINMELIVASIYLGHAFKPFCGLGPCVVQVSDVPIAVGLVLVDVGRAARCNGEVKE